MWAVQRVVPSREFTEWQALEYLDPWGDRRADWHAALICSVLANMFRDPKQRREPFTPKDFLLEFRINDQGELDTLLVADPHVDPAAVQAEQERAQADALAAKVGRINALLGGLDLSNRKDN